MALFGQRQSWNAPAHELHHGRVSLIGNARMAQLQVGEIMASEDLFCSTESLTSPSESPGCPCSASKSRNPCRFNSCSSRLEPLVSKNMRFFRNAGLIRLVIRRSFCSSGEGSGQESSSDILLSPSPKWPLKLARLQGKGRGLVVQKKVKKGEVLLIEEPFSFVFSERKSLYFFVVMLCRQEFLTPRNTVHLKPD
jgi:hypothetical protein